MISQHFLDKSIKYLAIAIWWSYLKILQLTTIFIDDDMIQQSRKVIKSVLLKMIKQGLFFNDMPNCRSSCNRNEFFAAMIQQMGACDCDTNWKLGKSYKFAIA